MQRRLGPALITPASPAVFPDPSQADGEGLIAIGGDLGVERLLAAYDAGIFPWYDHSLPPLWWSPDPRAVIDSRSLHVSRSMRRELKKAAWQVTYDTAFGQVIRECAAGREGGTWIVADMIAAYEALYRSGHAHSVEVWQRQELVGGLYGVQRGGLFAAESMFHRRNNASKVALIVAVVDLFRAGTLLFDVQFKTSHLASLGVYELARLEYLQRLRRCTVHHVDWRRLRHGNPVARTLTWLELPRAARSSD